MSRVGDVVVCETMAAYTTHARIVDARGIRMSGWHDGPKTPCGSQVAWDTEIPTTPGSIRCRSCLSELAKMVKL